MDIKDNVWTDFVHHKFGDEYLIRFISLQKEFRRWFKIITLLLSGGGIWAAFDDLKQYTIVCCAIIGAIQIISLMEGLIIRSEKDIEEIGNLRIMYYKHWNRIEKLYHCLDTINAEDCKERFFKLRQKAKEIEELDNKINVKKYRFLLEKAEIATNKYLKEYHDA